MATDTMRISGTVAGISVSGNLSETGDIPLGYEPSLPIAYAGTMSRDGDHAGTITCATGHGVTTGAIIDVYWTVSGVTYCAFGATAGTVAAAPDDTSVPFTLSNALSDHIPVGAATAVTFTLVTTLEDVSFEGDNLVLLAASCPKACNFRLSDAGGVEFYARLQANGAYVWASSSGLTNPVAGDTIISLAGSQSDDTSARTLSVAMRLDSSLA